MAELGENSVMEGFLCPICHKDMRSPNNLITHFQDLHCEEQDLLKSIKEIYGKAKKKILKLDDHDLELFKKEISLQKYCLEYSEPQEPGPSISHTEYFKCVRRERLDHRTAETNKLIIRLDRLLRVYGSDRKQHEQELVAWIDGTTVTRCPSCTSTFNLTRRQHHCRLCGTIMCNSCSYFMSYETAQGIVAPITNPNGREQMPSKESDLLRICNHCLDMLESRRRAQIDQMIQPIICQLYSHLQTSKQQIQNSVDMYYKMYNSIISGETTYFLQDLQSLRTSIADQAQLIDTLSKKIASLPVDDLRPKEDLLKNSIRKATSIYIKDSLLTIPAPPTLQEFEKIKNERSSSIRNDDLFPVQRTNIKKVTVTTGWSPANISAESVTSENKNPLLEQISIVKSYISQARKAKRFDEVATLTENLKMLEENYRQNQE